MTDDEPGRLAQWFQAFRSPLRRYFGGRLGVRTADLDDLAQEVFLRVLRYDREDHIDDPRKYLFRVAANVAAEWNMRAAQRLPHRAAWIEELADPERDVTGELERSQRDEALEAALRRLPLRMQRVTRLYVHDGLSHKAIAARMDLTPRVVKRDLIESFARLRADDDVLGLSAVHPPGAGTRKLPGSQ